MMLNSDTMVVEGYEEIPVDDMSELIVENEDVCLQYEEEDEDIEGYGGMSLDQYNDIVQYKRHNTIPTSLTRGNTDNRSAPSHWRARCKCFSMADDGDTLLYFNPENAQHNPCPRVVVKKGEVRKVLERVHEIIGHLGQKRTQMVVLKKLYWRSVRQDVKTFISNCSFCTEKKLHGRKITKAPVDITSETFDLSVHIRDTRATNGDRLEFELIGYNEAEVREAALTRMTSYTFKETANEYRSRYSTPTINTNLRRQPYIKRHQNTPVGYLLPLQHRPRIEPEFVEVFAGRDSEEYGAHREVLYDSLEPEIDDGLMRSRYDNANIQSINDKKKNLGLPEARPVTLLGNLLTSKNFKVDEPLNETKFELTEEANRSADSSSSPPSSSNIGKQSMNQRYQNSQKRMLTIEQVYQNEQQISRSPQPTTTAGLVKKRRRDLPSIRGMANRFSMAIGEADRIDNNEVNRSNPHLIEYQDPSSILRGDLSLPPVIMTPSTNDEVCKLQIEALQRHIHLQKLQEKYITEQYEASMRIPITRYIQQEDEDGQEEQLEVQHDDELNVIDDHYEDEHDQQIHH